MSTIIKKSLARLERKLRQTQSVFLYRRSVPIKLATPIISFTFDDTPQTAFTHGGAILETYGARGTFFVCLGMLEASSPSGTIASRLDLLRAVEQGHELGCHTFDHRDSWETLPHVFQMSVHENRKALNRLCPGIVFDSFAYPLCDPRPATKRLVGNLFKCCRGGGQAINSGSADLNLLKSFFIDSHKRGCSDSAFRLIDRNCGLKGWFIFATHDVDKNPSEYGCTRDDFREIVAYAASSGSLILPVRKACELIQNESAF